jgi:predicted nucleic acid-binding protein
LTTSSTTIRPLYVVDTNALIWYLKRDKKLGTEATVVFAAAERGETRLIVSAIVVAELFFVDQKFHLFQDFSQTYADLKAKPYFRVVPFHPDDVLDFDRDQAVPEMHDRIVTGLARRIGAPLLTSDPLILAAKLVDIVW